jgi:tartrate dehydrogenase/decarboxylase/D-malate dehydrogenase
MRHFTIAVWPGDGIGAEVTAQAMRVLRALEQRDDSFRLEFTTFPWGASFYAQHGHVVPDDYLDRLKSFDALFLGALGDPARFPDHITLAPLIKLRQSFDQYACLRPARLPEGVRSPLLGKGAGEIDLVVVRENSEGEYVDNGGRLRAGTPLECAIQTAFHSRHGVERILRFGFDLARQRRRRLTMITKSNALKHSFVLWDQIFEEISPLYADVSVDKQHVDAAAMNFVRFPERFDVVVASNLFGDILSDLAGVIAGGIGLAPSANINPERAFPSLFEPVHGSAPDIAGQGKANPVAAILSAALMLDWLSLTTSAVCVRRAVDKVLSTGEGTPDLGGSRSTADLTDLIVEQVLSGV